jgi:hypothetical protein
VDDWGGASHVRPFRQPGRGNRKESANQGSQRSWSFGTVGPSLKSRPKVCLDSSALAKRFVNEAGSDTVETLCAHADALGLCREPSQTGLEVGM